DARRKELNVQLAARGKKVSFTHLIGFAIVQAAKQLPVMTHAFQEVEGKPHRLDPQGVHLGLAVDVEKKDGSRALVVPVIKHAEQMDFAAFHATYETLVDKARTNKLLPDDFAGATITLTNPGTIGTVASVPRLMKGQGTIIATGAIRQIGPAKVMTLTSTYDPPGDPALDPGPLGLTPEIMARVPAEVLRIYVPGRTLGDAYPELRNTYCGTLAYEVEHIGSHVERLWLRQAIESGQHRAPLS